MELRTELQSSLGNAYTIERELGGGGMSRVFLAEETALKRQVVIKALPPEFAGGVSIERFQREIMLAARLQHAHIVPLITAGTTGAIPWFTMPYVEGESLRSRLAHGELPVSEAVGVLRDIATALAYAHERGVVHRDIKPENVMLSDGHALVTDFGVAKAFVLAGDGDGQNLTTAGMALGTPAYMSPEQITADPLVDHRADIYALGVVAYELLAGRNPFAGRSPRATMAAHVSEEPVAIASIRPTTPAALAALVTRCLAKAPADRPQSAREIMRELGAFSTASGGTPSGTRTPRAGLFATLRMHRSTTVGALLLMVAGVTWWRWCVQEPSAIRGRVAVMPFENLTGDTSFSLVGRIAANWLTEGIAQTDSADVVASSFVWTVLGKGPGHSTDLVRRVSSETRAAYVVTGNITRFGDSLRVQADLVDARSSRVIRAIGSAAGPVSDPLVAISALRERLLGSLASGDLKRRIMVPGPPPKYSAYREFLVGEEHFARGDFPGARQFYERAMAIDPTFFSPYLKLAATYTSVGDLPNAERVVGRLDSLREQLSATDRLGLDLTRAIVTGDLETELRTSQLLSTRLSDPGYGFLIGRSATRLLRPRIAIPALNAIDPIVTGSNRIGLIVFLANAHHQNGDHRSELATLERGRTQFPGLTYIEDTELGALAALHERTYALALADTMLRSQSDVRVGERLGAIVTGAMESRAHGDSVTARLLSRAVLDWAHANPVATPHTNRTFHLGIAWLMMHEPDSAAMQFQNIGRDTSSVAIGGLRGLTAARQGDTLRARSISDSLGILSRARTFGMISYYRAAILGQLGERERAVELLRQSVREGMTRGHFHYDECLESLRGYPPFEVMIAPDR